MMASKRRRSTQGGIAILFYATMLIFVIGCVGMAVDVGTIYMIKSRLSSAADAAALAAGRSVNLTNSVAQATTNASITANQFFAANFPSGYFNSMGTPAVTPTLTQEADGNGNPSGVISIRVDASVAAPTYFMNIFNVHSITVAASGTASRRGLVMMLVLDQSSSMGNGPGSSCEAMKASAQNFITLFSPFDQIGLITFDITAHLLDPPTDPISTVSTNIGNINCGANTNTISALELAYQQIKNTGKPLALNTIVLFTDGSPNGVTANFPARAAVDSRYGPSLNSPDGSRGTAGPAPPAQTAPNSCDDVGPSSYSTNNHAICVNMPAVCTVSTDTIFGTIAQWGNQNSWGADTFGISDPTNAQSTSIPASCNYQSALTGDGRTMRQFVAYIPDTDYYGNNLHGVVATGTGPTVSNGLVTRDNWIFQTNNLCSMDASVSPSCKNTGDFWSNHAGVGTGSNFFTAGPYSGFFRPDQPNSIVAAAMNGTMSEAFRIRSDATYHPVIHTIYLTGNSLDSVDREFLPIVANAAQITALPYDPQYNSTQPPVPLYANPAYQTTQETGKYLVTADKNALSGLFAQLASEVLRLSR
jgi:Flp pilus assembly protein TadG